MRVPMRGTGADQLVVATKSRNGDGAKGLDRSASPTGQPKKGGAGYGKAKPFSISKWAVWEAYTRVKANKGAAGVDGQTIAEFEKDLKKNLYKIWNRMSSGSYFPPPVRRVDVPKRGDPTRSRPLGVPAVSDRIAQMVCKLYVEPILEPHFHEDSYGYRPGKSAIEAVGVTRQRCWKYDWVVDLDIKSFFDTLDHRLLMKALGKHTKCRWVLLYVERWLKAPVQLEDGTLAGRDKGTPQGSVVSPLLSNLFLHYAFDMWMKRNQPHVVFERYADDIICHCRNQAQAEWVRARIAERLRECKLELHSEKTRIVYCKDDRRRGRYRNVQFEFLGFAFQPRKVKSAHTGLFVGYTPAISQRAAKAIRDVIRSWRIHRQSAESLEELSRHYNPIIRGWVNYYGRYCRSALNRVFAPVHFILVRWAMRKYKRFRGHKCRASRWLSRITKREPHLFAHWQVARNPG
jgi:RNA-directed DNA polymerase